MLVFYRTESMPTTRKECKQECKPVYNTITATQMSSDRGTSLSLHFLLITNCRDDRDGTTDTIVSCGTRSGSRTKVRVVINKQNCVLRPSPTSGRGRGIWLSTSINPNTLSLPHLHPSFPTASINNNMLVHPFRDVLNNNMLDSLWPNTMLTKWW